MIPGFKYLGPEAQAAQMVTLETEAQDVIVGCDFHFFQQGERVASTASLVPPHQKSDFNAMLRKLAHRSTDEATFDHTVNRFRTEFPNAFGWLSWYLQSHVVTMAFPAKANDVTHIRNRAPNTSNAGEHGHSLLDSAVGGDNDLIPGINNLFKHAKEFESRYNAVKGLYYFSFSLDPL
jgi:hypothetical protein